MKCPHCLVDFHSGASAVNLTNDNFHEWHVVREVCPACKKMIIFLRGRPLSSTVKEQNFMAYPKSVSRNALSPDVPERFAGDYREACAVLSDSAKASAALTRRCLQNILREVAGVKKSDLSREIEEVLASGKLPSHIAESIDAVRAIGNFAAHPMKSTNSGEILDVETGEAEWQLDVIESLFDYYFVQPAITKRKRDALNAKLTSAGKPNIK